MSMMPGNFFLLKVSTKKIPQVNTKIIAKIRLEKFSGSPDVIGFDYAWYLRVKY